MLRRYRFVFKPQWLVLHIFSIAVSVTMVLLGRWQLDVSDSKHFSIQNFGYALQWWLFTAFALFVWWRLIRDAARRGDAPAPATTPENQDAAATQQEEKVAYRRYVVPGNAVRSDDPVHTAYNEYLAKLAANDAQDKEQR